jgi:hypothetical protein
VTGEPKTRGAPEVCAELNITLRQLRYWCRRGWVKGVEIRGTGYPIKLTETQVERVREIAAALLVARTAIEGAELDLPYLIHPAPAEVQDEEPVEAEA